MTRQLSITTITYFEANYKDDNGKKVKPRRHIVIENKEDDALFLKLTGKRTKLSDYKISEIDNLPCLERPSWVVTRHKITISQTELKENDYQHFYICPFHSGGCLIKSTLLEIIQRMEKVWRNKVRDKKTFRVKAKELIKPYQSPW